MASMIGKPSFKKLKSWFAVFFSWVKRVKKKYANQLFKKVIVLHGCNRESKRLRFSISCRKKNYTLCVYIVHNVHRNRCSFFRLLSLSRKISIFFISNPSYRLLAKMMMLFVLLTSSSKRKIANWKEVPPWLRVISNLHQQPLQSRCWPQ